MIYFLFILDILVNNYTKYTSYFFLISLYNKSFKYYLLAGLILDTLIFNTMFLNTIILIIMYFLNKIFTNLNKENIFNFLFFSLFNYIVYITLTNLFMLNNIFHILMQIGYHLFINILFYILAFRIIKNKQEN